MDLFDTGTIKTTGPFFIRPLFYADNLGVLPDKLVLATTNGDITVDEQILVHFDGNTPGRDIKEEAQETWGVTDVTWGEVINSKSKGHVTPVRSITPGWRGGR